MYNYWNERIIFKEKIDNELMPDISTFIGKNFTQDVLDEIKDVVNTWLEDTDIIFTCEIKVDIEEKTHKIKDIHVMILDI